MRSRRLLIGAMVVVGITLVPSVAMAGIVPSPPDLPKLPEQLQPLVSVAAPIADQTSARACGLLQAELTIAGLVVPLAIPQVLASLPVPLPDIPGVDLITEASNTALLGQVLVAYGCGVVPPANERVLCPVDAQIASVLPARIDAADSIPNVMELIVPGSLIKYPRPLVPTAAGTAIATIDALGALGGSPGAGQPLADALGCQVIPLTSSASGDPGNGFPNPDSPAPAPAEIADEPLVVQGTDVLASYDYNLGTSGALASAAPVATQASPTPASEVSRIVHKSMSLARRMLIVLGILMISLTLGGAMAMTPEVAAARAQISQQGPAT